MKRLMEDANGIGLAATQVGVLQRLFVFQPAEDESRRGRQPGDRRAERGDASVDDEGCLSIQGVLVPGRAARSR